MKYLFCSLASHGFVYSAIGIALALCRRNHEVAFVTGPAFSKTLMQANIERIPFGAKDGESFQLQQWADPLAIEKQVKHIEYALEYFAPDVLVSHELTLGPLLVGELYNLPVAVLGLAAYLWQASESLMKRLPQLYNYSIVVWRYREMMRYYNQARKLFQLPQNNANFRETPLIGDLFLLQSVPELEGNVDVLPSRVHLVGACLWEPPQTDAALLDWLEEAVASTEPAIYVQPGRSFEQPGFWLHLVKALKEQPIRVVTATGRMDSEVASIPANFFVRHHIPQGLVLPYARAVISSGHTNPVLGALTHGLPSLLIPNGRGTEDIAERCQQAGVAICLPEYAVTAEALGQAVRELLNNSNLWSNVQLLKCAFTKTDGCERAANLLEVLGVSRSPVLREGSL